MSFTMEMPEKEDLMGGSNWLKAPGTYHLHITSVDEQPVDKDGKAVDGFKVEFNVLGGMEGGKKIDVIFFNPTKAPEAGKKNWPLLKQGAFLLAAGLVDPSATGKQVSVELQDAVDRQIVIEFSYDERDADKPADKKYLQVHYANIYHVDDPRAASVNKDAKALGMLPSTQRRDPASFKASGSNGTATPPPASQPAANDDLSDL